MSKIKLSYPTKKGSLSVTELSGTLARNFVGQRPSVRRAARQRPVACGEDGIRLALLARSLLRLKENNRS